MNGVHGYPHECTQVLTSLDLPVDGTYAGRVVIIMLRAGKLYMDMDMDMEGAEPTCAAGLTLPERVRPLVYMNNPADAVELASIRTHWVAGAPLAFALCLKRMPQRGLHLPTELAQRLCR